jgi:hypothetical protein
VRRDGARCDDATATQRTPGRMVARVPILTFSPMTRPPASRQLFRLIREYAPILAPLRRTLSWKNQIQHPRKTAAWSSTWIHMTRWYHAWRSVKLGIPLTT